MSIGAGVIGADTIDTLVGIRPGDRAYEDHTGAVYHAQNENNNGNVAHYEIQNPSDTIELDIRSYIFDMAAPTMVIYTPWGETDYNIEERTTGDVLITEQSGFDTDVWVVDVQSTDGKLDITQFDTTNGVDGTQAAWLPYTGVFDRRQ
jgi:hypothetical protein